MLKMRRVVLNNGLKLIMEKRSSVKTVAISVAVRVGTINENKGNNGIAHFVEHMLFVGTKKRSYNEIMNYIQSHGGSFGGLTQRTYTKYNVNIIDTSAERGIEILFDMIANSVFDKDAVERERGVIIEEINQQCYDQPFILTQVAFEEELNKGNSLGFSILGKEMVIRNISRDELYSFYRKYYVPKNITISVVGNIDYNQIENKVRMTFGSLKSKNIQTFKIYPRVSKRKTLKEIKKIGLKQAHIIAGGRAPLTFDKDKYPMEILVTLLGQTMNSRLKRKFINELGIAYTAGSYYNDKEGYYYAYLSTGHENLPLSLESLSEELRKLREEGITKDELEITKNYIKGVTAILQEQNQHLADEYAIAELFTGAEEVQEHDKFIDSVTIKDVNNVIKKYITANLLTLIIKPG